MNWIATGVVVVSAICGFCLGKYLRHSREYGSDSSNINRVTRHGHNPTLIPDSRGSQSTTSNESHFQAYIDEKDRLVMNMTSLSSSYGFPAKLIDASGEVSDEFIGLLDLSDDTSRQLSQLVHEIYSELLLLQIANAEYHLDSTGAVEWVRIRQFDPSHLENVSHLETRFYDGISQLLNAQIAEKLLKEHVSRSRVLGFSGDEQVFRFVYREQNIDVWHGLGPRLEDANVTIYSDLQDELPWWLARLVSSKTVNE